MYVLAYFILINYFELIQALIVGLLVCFNSCLLSLCVCVHIFFIAKCGLYKSNEHTFSRFILSSLITTHIILCTIAGRVKVFLSLCRHVGCVVA
jgi:hypothetical protein